MNAQVLMLKGYLSEQDAEFNEKYNDVRALLKETIAQAGEPAIVALAVMCAELAED